MQLAKQAAHISQHSMEAYTALSTGLQELIQVHVTQTASANGAHDARSHVSGTRIPSIFNPDPNRSRRKRVRDGEIPRKRAATRDASEVTGNGASNDNASQRGRGKGRGRGQGRQNGQGRGRGRGQQQAPTVERGESSSIPEHVVPPPPSAFDDCVFIHCSPGVPYTAAQLWQKMCHAWSAFMDDVVEEDVDAAVSRLVTSGKVKLMPSGGFTAAYSWKGSVQESCFS